MLTLSEAVEAIRALRLYVEGCGDCDRCVTHGSESGLCSSGDGWGGMECSDVRVVQAALAVVARYDADAADLCTICTRHYLRLRGEIWAPRV